MTPDAPKSVTLTGGRTFRLPAEPTLEQDLAVMDLMNAAGILLPGDSLDPDVPLRAHVQTATMRIISSGRALPLLAALMIEDGDEDWDEGKAVEVMHLFKKEKDPRVKGELMENLAPSVSAFFINAIRSSGLSLNSFPDLKKILDSTEALPSGPSLQVEK